MANRTEMAESGSQSHALRFEGVIRTAVSRAVIWRCNHGHITAESAEECAVITMYQGIDR